MLAAEQEEEEARPSPAHALLSRPSCPNPPESTLRADGGGDAGLNSTPCAARSDRLGVSEHYLLMEWVRGGSLGVLSTARLRRAGAVAVANESTKDRASDPSERGEFVLNERDGGRGETASIRSALLVNELANDGTTCTQPRNQMSEARTLHNITSATLFGPARGGSTPARLPSRPLPTSTIAIRAALPRWPSAS